MLARGVTQSLFMYVTFNTCLFLLLFHQTILLVVPKKMVSAHDVERAGADSGQVVLSAKVRRHVSTMTP
jgi:hypothetical protein